ncbi:MAG: VOC family protein [Clostridiales bacterium]|nr:VOC family protein [Clostridiales bacterium]
MILGVAHNAIKVSDMDKAIDFYCGTVGFTKAFDLKNSEGKPWIEYLKICNNAFLELFYGGEKRTPAYEGGAIGYHHWCVSVGADLMPELAKRFFAKGLIKSPDLKKSDDDTISLWIHDPDGNALEFVQYGPEGPHMKANKAPYDFTKKGYTGIAHMAYHVSDIEASLHYYRDILGFALSHTLDRDGKPWLYYLRVSDGTFLELYPGATKAYNLTNQSAAQMHMCIECQDVAETVAELRGKGAPIDSDAKVGADFNTQAWTHDPDGNKIELMTISPKSPQAKASSEG